MDVLEISDRFDILWDNLRYNNSGYPSLDEYEKSIFLTLAQEELVKNYANPKGNKYGEGVDDSLKRTMDFSNITETKTPTLLSEVGIDPRGKLFSIEDKVMFILNESVKYNVNGVFVHTIVEPLSYDEYNLVMSKKYPQPPKNTTWKLSSKGVSNQNSVVELIPHSKHFNNPISYLVRYIRRPRPIILEDLTDITIEGFSNAMASELNESMVSEIISRAVVLAENSQKGNLSSDLQLEQRSE